MNVLDGISKTAANIFGNPLSNPIYGAPTLVIVSCLPDENFPHVELANSACIIENMALAATNLGIGSVYILGALCAFQANKDLLAELNLPTGFIPVSSIALGYSNESLNKEKELTQNIKTNRIY